MAASCSNCGASNEDDAQYCSRCFSILTTGSPAADRSGYMAPTPSPYAAPTPPFERDEGSEGTPTFWRGPPAGYGLTGDAPRPGYGPPTGYGPTGYLSPTGYGPPGYGTPTAVIATLRPKSFAPGAVASLVMGIIAAIGICGIIVGTLAIVYGYKAYRTVQTYPYQ